jgi:hypothetical protein
VAIVWVSLIVSGVPAVVVTFPDPLAPYVTAAPVPPTMLVDGILDSPVVTSVVDVPVTVVPVVAETIASFVAWFDAIAIEAFVPAVVAEAVFA